MQLNDQITYIIMEMGQAMAQVSSLFKLNFYENIGEKKCVVNIKIKKHGYLVLWKMKINSI